MENAKVELEEEQSIVADVLLEDEVELEEEQSIVANVSLDDEEVDNGKEENGESEAEQEADVIKGQAEEINKAEYFTIELGGLPKHRPRRQFSKLIKKTLQLDVQNMHECEMGREVVYISFKDEKTRAKAMVALNGYEWNEATFTAKEGNPTQDPILLSRIGYFRVHKKEHRELPLNDRIQKSATPYHDMPYADQLGVKNNVVRSFLKPYGMSVNPPLKNFFNWSPIPIKNQVCQVDDFVEAPVKKKYYNRCVFDIGINKENDKPLVGFRIANYEEATVEMGPAIHLEHLNDKMKEVVQLMEKYLESSSYPPFDPFSHEGVWRQLTVRTSNNDDVMIIVAIHPQDMNEEEIMGIKDSLKEFFMEGVGVEVGITSIFFRRIREKKRDRKAEYEHVYGKTYIEETILGKTFRIPAEAFFQVNTPACEAVYKKITEIVKIPGTAVVWDICSGVGTSGLSIAQKAFRCMLVDRSVENARLNAENNDIINAIFYNGKTEDHIKDMVEKSRGNFTIALINDPKEGLSKDVINAILDLKCLTKIVYVCDSRQVVTNLHALGRPKDKNYNGHYFLPTRIIPVDSFPDQREFNLIILFERYDDVKWNCLLRGIPIPKSQSDYKRIGQNCELDQKEFQRGNRMPKTNQRQQRNFGQERRGHQGSDLRNKLSRNDRTGRGNWGRVRETDRSGRGNLGREREWNRRGDIEGEWHRRGEVGSGTDGGVGMRQRYGEGYQEGFQAALQVLGGGLPDFGQGGGWKMAKTQGGYGAPRAEEDFSMNPKESRDLRGSKYTGGSNMNTNILGGSQQVGRFSGPYQDRGTQSSRIPMNTHPQAPGYSWEGDRTGNWRGSNFGTGRRDQQGGTLYRSFEEPSNKKFKEFQ